MKELASIQQELKAPKNQRNNFGNYNYRSCEDILEAVKPLLSKNKCVLYISDKMIDVAGRVYVEATATIKNTSGEELSVTASAREAETKKGMDDSQITGSTSSYARKYALNGLFLIDDTKDADATNKHGKEEKSEVLKFTDYKKEMEKAKDITEVKKIASKYSKAVENVWNKAEKDEANQIYFARDADFAGE